MRDRVAQLAALVDRARRFGGHVAGDPARERELLEEALHALDVLRDVEQCSFALDGRILKMRLTVARRSSEPRTYRSSIETRFYMRNN